MQLTAVFLLTLSVAASAGIRAQQISFTGKDVKLATVLRSVERQSGYHIVYNHDLLESILITTDEKNVPLTGFLQSIFGQHSLSFSIENTTIFVEKKAESTPSGAAPAEVPPITVKGKVVNENGDAVMATITVKGTTKAVSTNEKGEFELPQVNAGAILVVSGVSIDPYEVSAANDFMTIHTKTAVSSLEQTVVVGYGTQKKATLTGALSTVGGEEIRRSPAVNLSNSLVGRLPGLVATTQSGEPGYDGATLRIRGANTLGDNSPLVVVDGIPNRQLERINPADVESVTILKDAMAAIYGAQAANGVILITTKRGKSGKPRISLNLNGGANQPTRTPKMANAAQYASILNELAYYANEGGGMNQKYSADDITKFGDGSDPWGHPNTDWFNEVFKHWSNQYYANLSLSGGTENLKYFISLGSKNEDGYYKRSASSFEQYNFRSNIDAKVSKDISVSFDVSGRQEVANSPTVSSVSIFRALMRGKPNRPAYWPSGEPGPELEFGDQPAVTSTDATGYSKNSWYRLESNMNLKINIPWVKGLLVQGNASVDKGFNSVKTFQTPWILYTWDGNPEHVLSGAKKGLDAPQLTQSSADLQNITLNAFATYTPYLNERNNLSVMAGIENTKGRRSDFSAFRKNYISAQIDQLFAGASDQYMSNNGSGTQSERLNYFGRVNYNFDRKYLFDFVWRYDGSYIFPKTKRFGFFPGISAGWRISEENFWKDHVRFLDNLKIRASWGRTGNDRIAEYQYLASYGFMNQVYSFGDNNYAKVLQELRIPNPNVTWEVADQYNVGFETQLLHNTLSVQADYFYNKRSNILWNRGAAVPTSTGLTLPDENIGKVSNKGFEGVITYHNKVGALGYSVSFNGSYAKNKILYWAETPGIPPYQQSTGKPMSSSLYYNAIGIFVDESSLDKYPHWSGARPGDVIFEDVNHDGKIDGLDQVRNDKNGLPRFTGGINLGLQYRNFDFALLFQGASGAQMYIYPESGDLGNYYKDFADNRWTPDHPSSTYPRAFNGNNEYWRNQPNTYWLRPTDYIRLKNLELGYTLPDRVNRSMGIENLRIYVNGLNLFTIDKEKLIDPESVGDGLGIPYPIQRVVNAGISLTF